MPQGVQLFSGVTTVSMNGTSGTTLFTAPSAGGVIACRVILNRLVIRRSGGWSTTGNMAVTQTSSTGGQNVLSLLQVPANYLAVAHPIVDHPTALAPGYIPNVPITPVAVVVSATSDNFESPGNIAVSGTLGGLLMRNFYVGPGDTIDLRFFANPTNGTANVYYSFTVITEI